jgi:hypothetical protein
MNALHKCRTLLVPVLGVSLLCAEIAWIPPAHAQQGSDDATRATARELGIEGIQAYQANDIGVADQKLERAYRLFAAPTLGLWSARARVKLGHLVEGAERYRQVLQVSPPEVGELEAQRAAREDAAKELKELVPRIPSLTLQLADPKASDVKVLLDNNQYPQDMLGIARPTNPGVHHVLVTHGSARAEQTVELEEKEQKNVVLVLQVPISPQLQAAETISPEAPAAQLSPENAAATVPSADRSPSETNLWQPIGIAAVSLGAAGLIVWGVSSLVADAKLADCPEDPAGHWCPDESKASSYRAAKTVSMVSFWSGLALAVGGGGALLAAAGKVADAAPSTRVAFTPTGVAVHGKF